MNPPPPKKKTHAEFWSLSNTKKGMNDSKEKCACTAYMYP